MVWWGVLGLIVATVVVVGWRQHVALRNTHTPLSSLQPKGRSKDTKIPLGMEAMDLDLVARTARKNESLERSQTNWSRSLSGSMFGRKLEDSDTDVTPLPDDETYAARFHSAFLTKKSKD